MSFPLFKEIQIKYSFENWFMIADTTKPYFAFIY